MSIESVILSNHLILCPSLLLLPSIFCSIRVFSNESALHIRWPTYWSFSINPSNEYSGWISFRIDWIHYLAVQKTLKNLLQQHSSKGSILWCSAVRQHIKKQKYHFTNKGPYNQSYIFSSSHVQMWELDHKESWAPKNWCLWTVVLEDSWEFHGRQGDQTIQY